jgi:hypothetical protein
MRQVIIPFQFGSFNLDRPSQLHSLCDPSFFRACPEKGCSRQPERLPAISRGLRSAERDDTPGTLLKPKRILNGCQQRPFAPTTVLAPLQGAAPMRAPFRGCRSAQPPANGCQSSGLEHPPCGHSAAISKSLRLRPPSCFFRKALRLSTFALRRLMPTP